MPASTGNSTEDSALVEELRRLRARVAELERSAATFALSDDSAIEVEAGVPPQGQVYRDDDIVGRLVIRLAASADIKNMVDAVQEATSEILSWDAHYFAVKRPHEGAFRVLHTVDTVDGEKRVFQEQSWDLTDFSDSLRLLLSAKPILINRARGAAEPVYTRFGDRSRSSASLMYVPIRSGEVVIGILSAQSYTHFRYNEADLLLFQRVADLVAPALERAYAEEALRRAHDELETRVRERTADLARANELLLAEIADRKRIEHEREQLQAQLRQAQKMEAVGRLSGGIAHDFNNFLTVILGNAQIALMMLRMETGRRDPVKIVEALEEIEKATQRAALLISQLLTFSRKQVANLDVLDAGRVIQGIAGMLRRLIREDIALQIDCTAGEHLIRADQTQIEQTLLNLAVNAVDAMPDGGSLTIRVTQVTLDAAHCNRHGDARTGPHVLIEVIDTGIGMDQHTLDHLFEPFFTTKPFGHGTGLGLATGYGIVKQSGGHIAVESRPGNGSSFKLYFPLSEGAKSAPAGPLKPEWTGGSATVLLCEDEESVRRLAASILTSCGYTVIQAESGEHAVRLAGEHKGPIQLLITDMVMPGIKGDSVAAAIRQDRPQMQALLISGYTADLPSVESMAQSGFEFLQKPFAPEVLLGRVRQILNKNI